MRLFAKDRRASVGASWAAAIAVQAGLVRLLASSLQGYPESPTVRDVVVRLISGPAIQEASPPPHMSDPSVTLVPPPAVVIDTVPNDGIGGVFQGSTQLLAPRPDPDHPNSIPADAVDVPSAAQPNNAILRIEVSADGSVADAVIARTSGVAALDVQVVTFVKAHWRYLPALLGTKAIDYWTTVLVRLSGHADG